MAPVFWDVTLISWVDGTHILESVLCGLVNGTDSLESVLV